MYTSPTLTNGNNKSIIIHTIITFRLRFQLKEIFRYNFAFQVINKSSNEKYLFAPFLYEIERNF